MFDEKKYAHDYYEKNKEKIKQRAKDWAKSNPNRYNKRQALNAKRQGYKFQRQNYHKRKLEILIHYGGNPPKCACCGETIIEFLTIDHNEVKSIKRFRSGDSLYMWIIKHNFPIGFRVLCMNCNHFIGHHGYCIHERIGITKRGKNP